MTAIELLTALAAIALGGWLASIVGSHFEGTWHAIVFWTIATVGSGIFFCAFYKSLITFFAFLKRRKIQKASNGKDPRNAAY
jgi:hypothetical protein